MYSPYLWLESVVKPYVFSVEEEINLNFIPVRHCVCRKLSDSTLHIQSADQDPHNLNLYF